MIALSVGIAASDEALNWELLRDQQAANVLHFFSIMPTRSYGLSIHGVRKTLGSIKKTHLSQQGDAALSETGFIILKEGFSGLVWVRVRSKDPDVYS